MVSHDNNGSGPRSSGTFVKRLVSWSAIQLQEIADAGKRQRATPYNKQFLGACLLVFLLALGVRLLTWHDLRLDAWKVQTYVTSDYKYSAYLLARRDFKGFLYDINHMGHPPGYPIVLAGIFKSLGDNDNVVQLFQVVCDSLAAVMVFLIVFELLPFGIGLIAGILAALSPQFAYHSVLVLPDSLTVLPILVAVYLLVRAFQKDRLLNVFLAGAMIGVSCWLRANALLMAPFLAIVLMLLLKQTKRLRFAAALLAGAFLVIVPLTIKNWIVFGHFVPLSLGAGQTMLEGIADYDKEKRFDIPQTDLGIMRQEAEWYQRPDYALLLFGTDGIKRERMRLARGFAVIRSHPAWFLSVMTRRALSSLQLDRVPLVAARAPVVHDLKLADTIAPVWSKAPGGWDGDTVWTQTQTELADDGSLLRIVGDDTKYGNQLVSEVIAVKPNYDYVFRVPLKLEEGRALLKVTGAAANVDQQHAHAASVVDLVEGVAPSEQALKRIELSFVSGNHNVARLVLANNASTPVRPVARLGEVELYELGPSGYQWTGSSRFFIRNVQRFFITAWMLPLAIFGIVLLLRAGRWQTVALLFAVPLYYLVVQSALHTERRYVIALHYFLTMFAAVFVWWVLRMVKAAIRSMKSQATIAKDA